MIEYIISVVLL